jgi:hypothetical protein
MGYIISGHRIGPTEPGLILEMGNQDELTMYGALPEAQSRSNKRLKCVLFMVIGAIVVATALLLVSFMLRVNGMQHVLPCTGFDRIKGLSTIHWRRQI